MKKLKRDIVHIDMQKEVENLQRSDADRQTIKYFSKKQQSQGTVPQYTSKMESGITKLVPKDDDVAMVILAALTSFGTTSNEFYNMATNALVNATCIVQPDKSFNGEQINALAAAMHSMKPQDEIEAMLISQMLATHFASMRMLRQTKNADTIPQQDSNGNLAIKLMRTYTTQMETLQKYRGKGQQKMTVEHVHVNAGGQAIIGNVEHKGGGVAKKSEEQPHAV